MAEGDWPATHCDDYNLCVVDLGGGQHCIEQRELLALQVKVLPVASLPTATAVTASARDAANCDDGQVGG